MKTVTSLLAVLIVAFAAGCATPEARIKKDPAFFASLAPNDQQLIREGRVAVGFTPEMVKLALGEPDHVFTRTDANGSNESWSYTIYETDDGVLLYRGFYHRYWGDPLFPYFLDYPVRREHDYLKVVFAGGRVASIEQRT